MEGNATLLMAAAGLAGLGVLSGLGAWSAAKRADKRSEELMREIVRLTGQLNGQDQRLQADGSRSREELLKNIALLGEASARQAGEAAASQDKGLLELARRMEHFGELNATAAERLRQSVEKRLGDLQNDSAQKLEQIRATVEEKLQKTLEQRLGESFQTVSGWLEQVHKGLGEMQGLAAGVGDLKKVLSNVKCRGILGELQLKGLLQQILTSDQFLENCETKKGSNQRVEFAIKLPGTTPGEPVLLPIDAKFPNESYLRLVEAQEAGDAAGVELAGKELEKTLRDMAKTVREKYLDPPHTVDFGILFLPTEGLYAEVLRRTGLFEWCAREQQVVLAGPSTIAALLSSLQMGFRTLAIEKRSSEVWGLLGAIKTEFVNFGAILEKTQKKLAEASSTIDAATTRTRAIQRKLKDVQASDTAESQELLEVPALELEE